jgi:hypothetical protein
MGRRELAEHREQLREGKRWLERMLAQTEKLMTMVDSKLASANEPPATATVATTAAPASAPAPAPAASRLNNHDEDWEFEERQRQRRKEFERLEEEAHRDLQEKERRDKERIAQDRRPAAASTPADRERERERERERDAATHSLYERDSFRGRSLAHDKDLERRELLIGGRRVGGVSPNGVSAGRSAPPASDRPAAAAGSGVGSAVGPGAVKPTAWEGETGSGLGSVALPRREPVGSRLGRGLWAFDN